MKSLAERAINALACRAGSGRGWSNRIECMAVHIILLPFIAGRWDLVIRAAQGIARELKGI